jgi:hypothetical protein
MNMQGNRVMDNNNKNKRKKLRTLVLSPNANDYDTGEYLYPNNFDNNNNDNKPDRMPFTNSLGYRFA